MISLGAALLGAAVTHAGADAAKPKIKNGGMFRIALRGTLGSIDPALGDPSLFPVLDATCARLMNYPDKPAPEGLRLVPEVAISNPRISNKGRTYTFTLRRGFRFSDGKPVRASAFERAITRTLLVSGGGAPLVEDILGAGDVLAGKATSARGVRASGNRLVVTLTRRTPDFPARMATLAFCAVPPTLPADPEGVATFAAAGPYYVAEHVRARRLVLKKNPFYGGRRPRHVDRFRIDGQVDSFDDVLNRVEQGQADWGFAPTAVHLGPGRDPAEKYGVNRSRFWLKPGLALRHYPLNTSRPLFQDARLRRAVNYVIDRAAVRAQFGGPRESRLTDHYLPPGIPGYEAARLYPHNLRVAKKLARGHTGSGKAVLYTPDFPPHVAAAQVIQQNLKKIGLDVTITRIPFSSYFDRLVNNPAEPWDIAFAAWQPDYPDPYAYLTALFDGQSGDQSLSLRLEDLQPTVAAGVSASGQGPLPQLREARCATRPRRGADGRDRLPKRGGARLEARRPALHHPAAAARPRRGLPQVRRSALSLAMLAAGAGLIVAAAVAGPGEQVRRGGTFRVVALARDFDSIDPAISYTVTTSSLLDPTCARLFNYPDKPPPEGFRATPEVAAGYPRVSRER